MGKTLPKGRTPAAVVFRERSSRSCARSTLQRPARIHRVTCGTFICVKGAEQKKAAVLTRDVFPHSENCYQPNESQRQMKRQEQALSPWCGIFFLKKKKTGSVSQDIHSLPESSVSSVRKKGERSSRSVLQLRYSPAAECSMKIPDRKRSINTR